MILTALCASRSARVHALSGALALWLSGCGAAAPDGAALQADVRDGSCQAPPLCPPRLAARGCRCVEAGWSELTAIPAHPETLQDAWSADPSRLWLVGGRGAVLRSTDGAQTFGRIDTGHVDNYLGVDSYDDRHLLVTSGAVRRLDISDDGGLSWRRSPLGPEGLGKCSYAPDAAAVCNDDGGGGRVIRYDLRTDRFSIVTTVPGASGPGLVRAANRLALALVPTGTETLVLRSDDGGESFAPGPALPLRPSSLWLAGDDGTALVGGSLGEIYRSTDGGRTFAVSSQGPEAELCFRDGVLLYGLDSTAAIALDPIHCLRGFFGIGLTSVWGSRDGGASFQRSGSGVYRQARAAAFGDALHGVVLAGNLNVTTDGGASYRTGERLSLALTVPPPGDPPLELLRVAFPARDAGFVVLRNNFARSLLRTADEGATWTELIAPASNALLDISVFDARSLVALVIQGDGGQLRRSADGGDSWTATDLGVRPIDLAFADPLRGVILGNDPATGASVALRTSDGGSTFTRVVLPGVGPYTRIAYAGRTVLIVGGRSEYLVSQDEGRSFSQRRSAAADDALREPALAPGGGVGWLGGATAAGAPILLRSGDGGCSFSPQRGPDGLATRLVAPSQREVLLVTGAAVYRGLRQPRGDTRFAPVWSAGAAIERGLDVHRRGDTLYVSGNLGLARRRLP